MTTFKSFLFFFKIYDNEKTIFDYKNKINQFLGDSEHEYEETLEKNRDKVISNINELFDTINEKIDNFKGNKVEVDKKIEAVAKKSQARKLNEVVEVNIFKDDNTVIQFKKPTVEYSFKEKVTFISGVHETKNLKEVFTSLVKQLGPKQLSFVKEATEAKAKSEKEKIDEAPELVEDFEEAAEKRKEKKKKKKPKKDKKENKKEDGKEEDKKEGETKEEKKEGETKEEPKEETK